MSYNLNIIYNLNYYLKPVLDQRGTLSTQSSSVEHHQKRDCIRVCVHAEKYSRNLTKSNQNQIVFTMHRLIWDSKWTCLFGSKSIGK